MVRGVRDIELLRLSVAPKAGDLSVGLLPGDQVAGLIEADEGNEVPRFVT